ncbi:MAG: VCBS repeat-containing protein [Planctomycetes bacterium]|nr:VCBS repeat-containing protein [Planctomycetota bacterium]MBI3843139.1 VCBS repeat-containing protein [Planctomycetota bacterium]
MNSSLNRGASLFILSLAAFAQPSPGQLAFDPPRTFESGHQTHGLATGDFDEDGHVDVAETAFEGTSLDNGQVLLFFGDGRGNLARRGELTTRPEPMTIIAVDLNGDGHLDLVVGNYAGFSMSVFLGTGTGTFVDVGMSGTLPDAPVLVSADVNADGYPDLVVYSMVLGGVAVLLGDGSGAFAPPRPVVIPAAASIPPLLVGDFDEDGLPDIIVSASTPAGSWPSDLLVYRGDGAGGSSFRSRIQTSGLGTFNGVVADLDDDGHLDLAVTSSAFGIEWFHGDGVGGFTSRGILPLRNRPDHVIAVDVDGDGQRDLVVQNNIDAVYGRYDLAVLRRSGPGMFDSPVEFSAGETTPQNLAAADFDDDCLPDLAFPVIDSQSRDWPRYPGAVSIVLNRSDLTASCARVESVVPSRGDERGGEIVHVHGVRLLDYGQATVSFGASAATVLDASPDRITVRTPVGSGTVDVSVTIRGRVQTLPAAFTFEPPEIASRYGNVNVGRGDPEDVLLVNGVHGDSATREITIEQPREIAVVMLAPSSRARARFALYVWAGAPTAATVRALSGGIGTIAFPTPLDVGASPQPIAIGNNFDPRLGAATFPTTPAPSVVGRLRRGIRRPGTVTLQGLIEDSGSQATRPASVTNAIVLRVRR